MKKFTSINNVASFKNGFAFKSKNYTTEGIRIIRISNVQDGKIIDKNPKFYPDNSTKDYSEYLLEDGDLLMSLTGDVGRVGFIKSELLPAYLNQRVLKVECDEKVILKKYIFYFFKSPEIYQKIIAMSKGVAQLNVSAGDIFQLQIPIPSLQEQEKIVERLDKVFENIDATLSNNALKKKLYNDYFESISWNEVFENQKFSKNPISDFFELDPSKSEILNENLDEVSFIPMADVDELIFEVDSKQIKDYKQVKKGYKYFANGDFLLAKITPCFENGKMGQVNNLKNKIGFGSTEFIVHRSKGKILNEWLFLLYSNSRIRKKLASTMSGAVGHKRISKEIISNLQICSPTIEEQKKIIDKLFMIKKIVDKKISIIDKETVKYSSLKKSILNKEFSYE